MVYLELDHVLALHALVIVQSGGATGFRNREGLESAVAGPKMTFDGEDLYPDLFAKAAALGHSLVLNRPFVDGNKRVGHAAMEVKLVLNGFEITASVEEQEAVILEVAAGELSREHLRKWLEENVGQHPVR